MGLLKSVLHSEQEKKHSLGVCIPDSRKEKAKDETGQPLREGSSFTVSGIFHVQDSLMLQGTMSGGVAKKKDKISFGQAKLVIKDLQVGNRSVETITPGETGAMFLKPEKGKFPIIRIGDVLEF